ncbi:MAG: TetR/AcrR family transcriptional regulator [Bacteroidota bacterium]
MSASARTGEHILSVAIRLYAEHGYAVTTADDIAKEAGVAKGLVRYYFHGKEGILLAALKEVKEELDRICQLSDVLSPEEKLEKLISAFCGSFEERVILWRMYLPLSVAEETREWARFQVEEAFQKTYFPLLTKIFSSLGKGEVDRKIQQFEMMRRGTLLTYLAANDQLSINELAESWKRMFLTD